MSEIRLKNKEKVITYGEIGSLLGFKSNAYEMVQVEDGEQKMSTAKGRI